MVCLSIGMDVRPAVVDPRRGLGRFARNVAAALLEMEGVRLTLFTAGGSGTTIEAWCGSVARLVVLPQPRRGAWLWDGPVWRGILRRHPVDVLHLPAWGVPPGLPVPVVATLHDVTPIRYPQAIASPLVRHRALQRLGTYHRATLVHAVSRATARDAVHILGIPPARVRTAPNGVVTPAIPPAQAREHVLFVGGADPHKRVELLLDAWLGSSAPDLPPLVVAGDAAAHPAVVQAAHTSPHRVSAAGRVSEEELHGLYRRAVAVVLPSLWEGFGLPALEAMAHGAVPVLTARSALPEAGGEAALYVPVDAPPGRWAETVLELVRNPSLARRLRGLGAARARRFSWAATAARLVEIYREAVMRASS